MPNWCGNRITITGPEDQISVLLKKAKGPDAYGHHSRFTFHSFVPMPANVDRHEADGPLGWYDWSVEHWGTKWDVQDDMLSIKKENDRTVIEMDTAWSPPTFVVEAMAREFPELDILHEWVEVGNIFAGRTEYKNGAPINREEWGGIGIDGEEKVRVMANKLGHKYY